MSKKYQIIYADPPWRHSSHRGNIIKARKNGVWGLAEFNYKTMSKQDIMNYPVQKYCADDCMLFLWSTFPLLQQGMDVMKAWGFKYRTIAFVWVKTLKDKKTIKPYGLGHYTLSNCEVVLLGRKGKFNRNARNVKQVILSPITKHSEKPAIVRDRIVDLCGPLPRIELFARQKVRGWKAIGDQIDI